ncbi:hypothetical protein [Paraburkholderia megapolitana]|uniref:hypothetical protein n=1 Tax=Paraburkholderia megapolitana TaxID=420953 RepID=UPI0038BAA3CD
MNTLTKTPKQFTSIADWEKKYLPNAGALDLVDFGSEPIDEDIIDSVAKELSRPVQTVQQRLNRRGKSGK